ncbi:Asp23/Gls24 family envelope stress response protein [Streptomyces sp. PSKA30]|uniref:Asp23/Gls24 family envelope stress response protein n=1 Tax=Streptomyces sp. PSKA30 TaxID=2874597 RepID=UPI001CD181AF|nr:Asp23/Gls24 family envelope stress response protein [Streptomyces sp. PSKA30]MBZ9638288.1 Asp23/Gls24 family envelope stress response protein [Streptomyces sp. PSKA30]
MSTGATQADSPAAGAKRHTSAPPLPPAAERGATVISEKAVARVAARAARTALGRQTGGPLARQGLTEPDVFASTHGGRTRLALSLDLPYPADLVGACRQLSNEIADDVSALTGLQVSEVTLTVRRLVHVSGPRRHVQ